MRLSRGILLNAGIGALACASLVAVLATSNVASTRDSDGREQNLLSVFESEDATRVEISQGGQKIAFERANGDAGSAAFLLVEPVKELADAATIDKFLSALSSARALRPVDQGPALSSFGLDKPTLRVVVRTAKRVYRIALGGPAPAPVGARYVQVSADSDAPSVVVVSKSVADDLAVELDAFRLRSLVSLDESAVTRVAITSPKLSVALRRSTGTNFLVEGEPKLLADRDVVKSLFFQLGRLSATRFLSTPEAESALGVERAHFEIESKDPKQRIVFDAGGNCPEAPAQLVVIRRLPDAQSGCAPRELEATLQLAASDFRDRHAFSLHADEVEELDITGDKQKFALVRKGSAFVLHASAETQVELEAGNQRISALLETQGERIEAPKLSELGLDPARISVTLRSSAARDTDVVEQVVRVGNTDAAGNLLVYREQDSVTLRIPREQARAFAVDSTLLYSRKLTEFGISSFVSADIESGKRRQVLRRGANEELQLDAPKGFDPDGALSAELMQALGALTAERFVADHDDGTFGLGHPALSVRFAFKDAQHAQVERRLRFGDETALGVFATLDEGGPVFILSRSLKDSCDTLLINRSVFPTVSDSLMALTLEAHGRTLRVERQGERFAPIASDSFPKERVTDILEAIADLRPEAGIHTGRAEPGEGFSKPSLTLRLTPRVGGPVTLTFGAGDSWHATSVFYLRVSGVDATYVVAQSKVRALSDAL